jgi:hypothetical protein
MYKQTISDIIGSMKQQINNYDRLQENDRQGHSVGSHDLIEKENV